MDGESGRHAGWDCGEGDSERQESVWIGCRSRVRTTSDGESSIDMEPLTLSLDNYESGGRSVHDDIRDCLAGYAKLPTPMPMPMPTTAHLPTMYRGRLGRRRRPPATTQAPTLACTHRLMAYAGPGARTPRQRQGMGECESALQRESEKSESVLRSLRMA